MERCLLLLMLFATKIDGIRIFPKSQRGNIVRIPLNGPCILNNEQNGTCTDKGYYEMVQCDDSSCFCVDARNGIVAYGTRTTSKQITPHCSSCHNQIKNLYAHGEPVQGTFVPRCDRDKGDYEPLQCDANGEYCMCVNPSTGVEIPGSRKKKENNHIFHCDRNENSIGGNKGIVETNAKPGADGQVLPVGRDYCKFDRNRGQTCTKSRPTVMYYFDASTFDCLAFEYKGCGGNENRFYTKSDCQSTCILPDFFACSGLKPPAKNSAGAPIVCGGMMPDAPRPMGDRSNLNPDGCPSNYQCLMGAFFGFCCEKASEAKFAAAYRPSCPRAQKPFSRRHDGYDDVLLGKSCSDNFCPSGYNCHDGEIFAYCCK